MSENFYRWAAGGAVRAPAAASSSKYVTKKSDAEVSRAVLKTRVSWSFFVDPQRRSAQVCDHGG